MRFYIDPSTQGCNIASFLGRKVHSNLPYPVSPNTTSKTHTKMSLRSWRAKVLSHLSDYPRDMKMIKKLVWNGIPSSIRGEVIIISLILLFHVMPTQYDVVVLYCRFGLIYTHTEAH